MKSDKLSSSQMFHQTAFVCLPLRLAVLLTAVLAFASSFVFIVAKVQWEGMFRHFVGGYSLASKVCVGAIQYTGIGFSYVGIMGCWYNKRQYVITFNYWQMARVVAWCLMYYVDLPLINNCEEFVNNVVGSTQQFGWNSLMYEFAMSGKCSNERDWFFACSILTLVYFLYCIAATARFAEHMDRVPKHLLRPPKDLASSALYSHSTGERNYMNGIWGKHDQAFIGQGPPVVPGVAQGAGQQVANQGPQFVPSDLI